MTPLYVRRCWSALAVLILIPALLAGCSKDPAKPEDKVVPPPQYQVDDIAQVIGTTVSVDNGGWYALVKVFCDTLSHTPPDSVPPELGLLASRWSVPLSSGRPSQLIDFSVPTANPGISYNVRAGYWDAGGSVHALRDTSCERVDAYVALDGGTFTIANNGLEKGSYGLHAGILRDSSFSVSNLRASDPDTLVFSGSADDSCYALVHSMITVPSSGLWYYHTNFFDYEFSIPKANLLTSPYPVAGEVNWLVEVFPLIYNGHDPARNDFNSDIFCEAQMKFDGTQEAILSISDTLIEPHWIFRYRVNLNTGIIARL